MTKANSISSIEELCAAIIDLKEAQFIEQIEDINNLMHYIDELGGYSDPMTCFSIDTFQRKDLKDRLLSILPDRHNEIERSLKKPSTQELNSKLRSYSNYLSDYFDKTNDHFSMYQNDLYQSISYPDGEFSLIDNIDDAQE